MKIKNNEIDKIESDIIAQMPKDISPKEAVNYFCIWIKNNMNYNYQVVESEVESELVHEYLYNQINYANAAYEQSIIQKQAICSGFSIILSKLCNRVGINLANSNNARNKI